MEKLLSEKKWAVGSCVEGVNGKDLLKPVFSLLGEDVPEDNDTDWQFVTLGEQVSVLPRNL